LGEFLPCGRFFFTLGGVLKITLLNYFTPRYQLCIKFDKYVIGWDKFWVTFSQTHLATLYVREITRILYLR
jgi:hypothetical protein